MKKLLSVAALTLATGCTASVHQVAMGGLDPIPEGAKVRHIQAQADQFVFMYITDNTDYADRAFASLLSQCPHGEVRGIETRYGTTHGFLSFKNHLRATALCVE